MTYYPPTKPEGDFALQIGDYKRLDIGSITPKDAGVLTHLLYINVKYRLTTPTEAGKLTVKLVRAPWKGKPADPTAYQTFDLVPTFDSRGKPRQGTILVSHTYFEWAEAGRPCNWEAMIQGASGYLSTRYRKAWA